MRRLDGAPFLQPALSLQLPTENSWSRRLDGALYLHFILKLHRRDGALKSGDRGADESAYRPFPLGIEGLQSGRNVLAVELHQASHTSSDIRMDLELTGQWPPLAVSMIAPDDGEIVGTNDAHLQATVMDPAGMPGGMEVTYLGRKLGNNAGPDFTLIALPDTQYYTGNKNGGSPDMFIAQAEWILRERVARNIAFVTQLGDCVENGDNGGDPVEWLHATNALYRLENPLTTLLPEGLPYGFAPGNHDLSGASTETPGSVFFNQFFGTAHFSGRAYYGGHHGTNNNDNFQLFSASGLDFIMVHLQYDTTPESEVLQWADQLLQAHPHRKAIIVSHYLIEKGEQSPFGAQGQRVYDALKENRNLLLMLSGHVPGEGRRQDQWKGRPPVHTLLADYQGRPNGGDGWLRILEFSPSNQVVRVRTYSPTLDKFEKDADSEFTLACDLNHEIFQELGRETNVPSGAQTSLSWTDLEPATSYEWCVEITDGFRTEVGPIQSLTTESSPKDGQTPDNPEMIPVIQSMRIAGGLVTLVWSSVPDLRYRVCFKQELSDPTWTDLSEDVLADGSSAQWIQPLPSGIDRLFYAIRVVAPTEIP